MKSAEAWYKEISLGYGIEAIERIQLDAIKEGMTRAAEVAKLRSDGTKGTSNARLRLVNEILAARDDLKEI